MRIAPRSSRNQSGGLKLLEQSLRTSDRDFLHPLFLQGHKDIAKEGSRRIRTAQVMKGSHHLDEIKFYIITLSKEAGTKPAKQLNSIKVWWRSSYFKKIL